MSKYDPIKISPEMRKRIRESLNNPPIGFRCWDCGSVLPKDGDLYNEGFIKSPVDIDGYILVICKICWDEG